MRLCNICSRTNSGADIYHTGIRGLELSPDACIVYKKFSRHAATVFEWYLHSLEHSITEVEDFYVVNCERKIIPQHKDKPTIHSQPNTAQNATTEIWGPIYKESYARLMTAQHLRRTYAELVNCEWLTKNHTLNLRKIFKTYAKLRKNLWPHKYWHNSIKRGNYVILLTLGHFQYSLIKQEDHRIKSMTHLTQVFYWNIFERDLSDAA